MGTHSSEEGVMRFIRPLVLFSILVGLVVEVAPPAQAGRHRRGRELPIPTVLGGPFGITSGPDGNLWFTEVHGNKIGQVTTQGVFTEFPVPTAGCDPYGIAAGPDGNLWFTEY